jgi:hypothetical protein
MFRENWSKTMISARRPRGVSAQWSSSPPLARSNSSPNRSVISLSTSGPPCIHRSPWRRRVSGSALLMSSGNQYERTSSASLSAWPTSGCSRDMPLPPSCLTWLSRAADDVQRARRVQHRQRRGAQERRYLPPWRGHPCPRSPKPAREHLSSCCGRGRYGSRGRCKALIAPLPRSGVSGSVTIGTKHARAHPTNE